MVQQSSQISLSASTEFQHFGMRLDQVVADLFPDYSRSKLKEWILAGNVCVNGEPCVVPRQKMTGDEVISVEAEIEQQVVNEAQAIELDIVYEDEDILIINKPADLVVHPGAGNQDGTLLNALLAHVPDIDKVPRAGIVHRLDKDTTGLMVVAKTLPAQTHLVDQLQSRVMSREYEALVNGTMVAGGLVDAPIGRHSTKRTHMAVREMGKPAVTHYRVIEKFRAHTHVRLKLETGRTHQIRVHMSEAGTPLVGDVLYGGANRWKGVAHRDARQAMKGMKRQALHAHTLAFDHPVTGDHLQFEAPLPEDMELLIQALRACGP